MSIKKLIVKEEIPDIYQFAINRLYREIVKSFNQINLVNYRLQTNLTDQTMTSGRYSKGLWFLVSFFPTL